MEKIITPNFILDISIHSIILFTFLSMFYYFYSARLSQTNFNEEIYNIIDSNLDKEGQNYNYNNSYKKETNIALSHLSKDSEKEDPVTFKNNMEIFDILLYINITLWSILAIVIFKLGDTYEFNYTNLLIANISTFIIIGIAEFLFFTQVITKYIPVKKSFITKNFIDDMKDKIN
jgi:hypothetical protein